MQGAIALSIGLLGESLSKLWATVTVTVHETVAAVAYDETVLDVVQSVSKIHPPTALGAGSSCRYEAVPDIAQNKLWLGIAWFVLSSPTNAQLQCVALVIHPKASSWTSSRSCQNSLASASQLLLEAPKVNA